MSRDWTPEELAAVSTAMKAAGNMGYEEFCEELECKGFGAGENDTQSPSVEL